jgi:hypothetical protein
MKIEQLKLYNKYRNVNYPDIELIYIGIDNENQYWFLTKKKNYNIPFSDLTFFNLNPDKIVKGLNLETGINYNGEKYIKYYYWIAYSKERVENYFTDINTLEYRIGIDTDCFSYCLMRKNEVLLSKRMNDENEFKLEVDNLAKYFNACIIES